MTFRARILEAPQEEPLTYTQDLFRERMRKGILYFWTCDDAGKEQAAMARLIDLVYYLRCSGYRRCLYPGGIPEELRQASGTCLMICPIDDDKWQQEDCPAWETGPDETAKLRRNYKR